MTTSHTLALAALFFFDVVRVAVTSRLRLDLIVKVALGYLLYLLTWWAFLPILISSGMASSMSPTLAALTLSLAALGCLTLLHAASRALVVTVVDPAVRVVRRRELLRRPLTGAHGDFYGASAAACAPERDPVPSARERA